MTGERQRRARWITGSAALTLATVSILALAGCGVGATVDSARNAGVCTTLQQGLDTLDQNIDKVKAGVALPPGTEQSVTQAKGVLDTATSTATGQLATSLTGLDASLNGLLQAALGGSPTQVTAAVTAVKTDLRAVQAQCASS